MSTTKKRYSRKGETLADLSDVGLAEWYESSVFCSGQDVYRDLRTSYKTDNTSYTMEFCKFRNEYYLTRECATGTVIKKRDPAYMSLSHEDWHGEEYSVDCVLPQFSIANPWTLSETFIRKIPGVEMFWVSIENRVHECPVTEDVLSGLVDKFHVFGLQPPKKRKALSAVNINKKRKIIDSELRRVLTG